MGIGPSTKETSRHHFHDPLLEIVSADEELDLMGIMLVGTPDGNADKMLVGTRAAVWAEAMRADGVIISSDQLAKRGIAVAGLDFCGTAGQFVVESDNLDAIVDINKNPSGVETCVLGENSVNTLDARKAAAMLKLKMRKMCK